MRKNGEKIMQRNISEKLIVIEGLDGSGKNTQASMLADYISKEFECECQKISFPQYGYVSSGVVEMYLRGEIEGEDNPFLNSILYTIDRAVTYRNLWGINYHNGVVVADRYTTSNVSHQMSKIPSEKQEDYIKWLMNLEYEIVGVPKPDLVIYLDMTPEISRELILARYNGDESKLDLHEKDLGYLKKCRDAVMSKIDILGWTVITCGTTDNKLRGIDDIHKEICEHTNKIMTN